MSVRPIWTAATPTVTLARWLRMLRDGTLYVGKRERAALIADLESELKVRAESARRAVETAT